MHSTSIPTSQSSNKIKLETVQHIESSKTTPQKKTVLPTTNFYLKN